jgi:hypothetical protein
MRIIISALNNEDKRLFFSGYTDVKAEKGLGSGALTGTNRVPLLTAEDVKEIKTFIDAKRIMSEIIDAIRYEDIEGIESVTMNILRE